MKRTAIKQTQIKQITIKAFYLGAVIFTGLFAGFLVSTPALAQYSSESSIGSPDDVGIISIQSSFSVKITAERLEQALRSKGLKVFGKIDHAAQAAEVKLALRPTVLLLFGDPKMGTLLMHENETFGLDLPMKYLIWETADHSVFISWNNPYFLARRHGVPQNLDKLSTLSQLLVQTAKKAASKP